MAYLEMGKISFSQRKRVGKNMVFGRPLSGYKDEKLELYKELEK